MMTHLSDDELLELAEATEEQRFYSQAHLAMLDHLEACIDCYRKFCCARVLYSVTSDYGFLFLDELHGETQEEPLTATVGAKLLAAVSFVVDQLSEKAKVVLQEAESFGEAFSFRPAPRLAYAMRGSGSKKHEFYEFEDTDDHGTCISIDTKANTLSVQIHTDVLENKAISVYLKPEEGDAIPIRPDPEQEEEGFWIGTLKELPAGAFRVIIEEVEET